MKINGPQIATLALGALMVAPILAAPVMRSGKSDQQLVEARAATYFADTPDPRRAWKDGLEVPGHRLVGLACGADRLTMTAREEDEFPRCDAIDTPADMCPTADGSTATPAECAAYMGDGW